MEFDVDRFKFADVKEPMMLILLPGMDGTGELFEAFVSCLPAGSKTKIVRYPADVYLTYQQLEELVIDGLPVDVSYTVIAESFSAPIALRIAARRSTNLEAVVVVAGFAYRPLGWIGSLVAALPLEFIFGLRLPDLGLRIGLLGTRASAESVRRTQETISSVDCRILAARLREALTSVYGRRDVSGDTRVVVLHATNDCLLGRRARASIVEVCPTAEVASIAGPHLAMQEVPLNVIDTLRRLRILH